MEAILETHDLSRSYNRSRVRALQGVSLRVAPGRIFGLLGPNGAGKTTFVKIMLGLVRPHAGSARLFDRPVQDAAARRKVGYLPENHRFPGYLTGADFLAYCSKLSGLRDAAQIATRTQALLKRVSMWEWRQAKIKKYSKGMAQRLGLAQALIHDPELIFLDEPTDGVDPIGRKEIRDILIELKEQGKTIFLNSHLLSEVEMICDEVAILDRGRLVRQGSVQELTTVERRFRIHTRVEDAAVVEKLRAKAHELQAHDSYLEVSLPDSKALNALIDILRAHRCLIHAIVPVKQSLEQSFMQLIEKVTPVDEN